MHRLCGGGSCATAAGAAAANASEATSTVTRSISSLIPGIRRFVAWPVLRRRLVARGGRALAVDGGLIATDAGIVAVQRGAVACELRLHPAQGLLRLGQLLALARRPP